MDKHTGIIKFVFRNKGYGFILDHDGSTIFFHASGLCGSEFSDLREGSEVEFDNSDSHKGPKAIGLIVNEHRIRHDITEEDAEAICERLKILERA